MEIFVETMCRDIAGQSLLLKWKPFADRPAFHVIRLLISDFNLRDEQNRGSVEPGLLIRQEPLLQHSSSGWSWTWKNLMLI